MKSSNQLYMKPVCELPPIPMPLTKRFYETFGDHLKCCEGQPSENRLACFEGKFKEFLRAQEMSAKMEIESRDNLISTLESQKANITEITKIQEKLIKNLTKSADHKQVTINEQNKTIKLLKQRISKADKQSTKNHNLKMHTQTLKSKVSKLQEENDTMKECQLCFEQYDNENRKPCVAKCIHVFCKDCLTKHTHSNSGCPMCRKRYAIRDIRELHLHFV